MISDTQILKKYRQQSLAIIIIAIIIALITGFFASIIAGRIAEQDLRSTAQETLAIQVETLTGQLDKYRLLSATLARRSDIADIFTMSNIELAANKAKKIAVQSAAISGALNVVFIRPDGQILASGLGAPIGRVDPSSKMIIAALQGRLGRQVNILNGQKRAYTFASAVRQNDKFVGIIAIYVGLAELEANWSLTKMPILAVDARGTVIMSNQPQFRLKALNMISTTNHRYRNLKIAGQDIEHLDYIKYLPLVGWELHVLSNSAPITSAKLFWGIFAGFIVLLFGIISQMLLTRQMQISQKARNERATSLRLERLVRERTKELTKTNKMLASEVEERKTAEQQLRKTQNELIQSGKLAALGQMSASLSHEYNQPLSATKTYADNALKYLQLGRNDEAKDNISRISGLVDRMSDISKHLRNFARKPNTSFGAISLKKVVNDALDLMSARIKGEMAQIELDLGQENIYVMAGNVRLQQVIVNLISNALDVMQEEKQPLIKIYVSTQKKIISLHIRDYGHGIDPGNLSIIFDPFFTTKEVGKGLGLGLSVSYNIIKDFGGNLYAQNHKQKGAIFTIELNRAKAEKVKEHENDN